ncbi:MAG: hypothetical protein HUU38_28285 [Anaerolineales bacterium]|nr:hypothetical protein [Anaerolineales bacterium]
MHCPVQHPPPDDFSEAPEPERGPLTLPTPYPEYLPCPHCGEPEVEIWCYESGGVCHACGEWIVHEVPVDCHHADVSKRAEANS